MAWRRATHRDHGAARQRAQPALTGRVSAGDQVDNINLKEQTKGGTDPAYTLARLKRDRPDLAAKVIKRELSANAAAIQAGFRKKKKCTCPECGYEWTP